MLVCRRNANYSENNSGNRTDDARHWLSGFDSTWMLLIKGRNDKVRRRRNMAYFVECNYIASRKKPPGLPFGDIFIADGLHIVIEAFSVHWSGRQPLLEVEDCSRKVEC